MSLSVSATVHNKYEFEVFDSKTGEKIQEAVAYNVVTDSFFKARLCAWSGLYDTASAPGMYARLCLGSGSGTPSTSDTALFNQFGSYSIASTAGTSVYPTWTRRYSCYLNESTGNGNTITEVGLLCNFRYYKTTQSGTSSAFSNVISHAMLEDAHGSPTSIEKTENKVVYIYVTLYLTLDDSDTASIAYNRVSGYGLLDFLTRTGMEDSSSNSSLTDVWNSPAYTYACLSKGAQRLKYAHVIGTTSQSNNLLGYLGYTSSSNTSLASVSTSYGSPSADLTNFIGTYIGKTMPSSFLSSPRMVWGVYTNFFCVIFPDHSVLPVQYVYGEELGEGDGSNTEFNISHPYALLNSGKVYVDGIEMTKGTDYTIDEQSNGINDTNVYDSTGLLEYSDSNGNNIGGLIFGSGDSGSSTSNGYSPTQIYSARYYMKNGTSSAYKENRTVTSSNPIFMDYGSPTRINRLIIKSQSVSPATSIVIEYSSDNSTWNIVTYTVDSSTTSNLVYSFSPVTARYWRVYRSGVSWSYSCVAGSFLMGYTAPTIVFTNPPAAGSVVTADYAYDIPYKTSLNKLNFQFSLQLGRSSQ